jgi:hypothetical protein
MRAHVMLMAITLMTAAAAGCVSGDQADDEVQTEPAPEFDHERIAALIGEPIEVDHDHRDPVDHVGGLNLELVSWSTLDVDLGSNGYANFVFYQDEDEDLIVVAVDGDTTGGFVIVDISDPTAPEPLGRYMIDGNNVQEVRVFPGGQYALMNVQKIPSMDNLDDPVGECTVCMHVVDISDRSAPAFVSAFPVDLLGTHNMDIYQIDGGVYVFYVGQPLTNAPPGNYVGIARFVEGPGHAQLVKVAEWRLATDATAEQRSFPHDVIVFEHPITDQTIAYVSHWQSGAVTVDVSVPAAPMQLDVYDDPAPSAVNNIHWMWQETAARQDGRVIGWSAPEIGQLDSGSGVIRAYDMTDPAALDQIGTWALPGNVTIPAAYIFSPHTTVPDMERGLLAVSHYHAGVWILDISDPTEPRALGYYMPNGPADGTYEGEIWWKKPNFDPEGFLPNVYQARWDPDDGTLWVSERGTGLYALNYTGPVPGPLA